MESIKKEVLKNRMQVQIENKQSLITEFEEYKDKITEVYRYLYSIAHKFFKKQNSYTYRSK